jgi:protein-L-isoaspartate(D-aspartate) O-methyltransferase
MDDWAQARERMVVEQLEARGLRDKRVLDAMRRVPRHLFVPPSVVSSAYEDRALPIGDGQTISQPYMVAVMTRAVIADRLPGRVLEIGTGSGYQAAVLSLVAREVFSIERLPAIAASARERLQRLGYLNVEVVEGDGTSGLPQRAPSDGIIVTAGAPHVPEPLKAQLEDGGRLVIPIGSQLHQALTLITKVQGRYEQLDGEPCVFVPLVGQEGWPER